MDLVKKESKFRNNAEWAFRGQKKDDYPANTLERLCSFIDVRGDNIIDLEIKLIRDFARSYHLYGKQTAPQKGNTLEWLSLLRHYGAPTRLVDFTYSFFIATYFALEKMEEDRSNPVVWAINVTQVKNESQNLIKKGRPDEGDELLKKYHEERDAKSFRDIFMMEKPNLKFVYPTNPIRMNERLTIQQGLFLTPGDVRKTFWKNLQAIPNYHKYIMKFSIDRKRKQEILYKLHRMGINRATLFPDLEGFANSLSTKSLILSRLPKQEMKLLEQV
jgi:hypothetical protein